MGRKAGLALLAAGLVTASQASQAHAAAILFQPTNVSHTSADPAGLQLSVATFPAVDLFIDDSAISSGSFKVASTDPMTVSGDSTKFVGFLIGDAFFSLGDPGQFSADLTFASDGSVSNGSLLYVGDQFALDFSGSASSFGGTYRNGDSSLCNSSADPLYACNASGIFATVGYSAVAEPGTAALLFAPVLAGVVLTRSRRR